MILKYLGSQHSQGIQEKLRNIGEESTVQGLKDMGSNPEYSYSLANPSERSSSPFGTSVSSSIRCKKGKRLSFRNFPSALQFSSRTLASLHGHVAPVLSLLVLVTP